MSCKLSGRGNTMKGLADWENRRPCALWMQQKWGTDKGSEPQDHDFRVTPKF